MAELKTCYRCGTQHNRSHRWCLNCHNANMREWRKMHPLNNFQRKKDAARSYAGVYKRKGKIRIEPCKVCGSEAQMHHSDYSQPLLIEWLCRKHHMELRHAI